MVALNSTAVTVMWTPVTLQETEYCYTIQFYFVTKQESSLGKKNFES